jgi:predicted transcriptional regulator
MDAGPGEGAGRSQFPGFADLAPDALELIRRLVEVRHQLGLSQTDVAARMGTSQSAVARLEAGQSDTRLSTLGRYAAALDTRLGFAVSPEEHRK